MPERSSSGTRDYMHERAQKFRDEYREGSAAWLLAGDVLVLLREIEAAPSLSLCDAECWQSGNCTGACGVAR